MFYAYLRFLNMLIIQDVNTLLRPLEICRLNKGWNKSEQLSIFVKLLSLQSCSLPRLLCVALLVLHQGVDGQGQAEAEDRVEVAAGGVGQPPVISDRILLLQVRQSCVPAR